MTGTRWDLRGLEVSQRATAAALQVVAQLTRLRNDVDEWATAIRLAQRNGASLREIAEVARVAPQTVAKVCRG